MNDLYDETVDIFGISAITGKLDGQTTTLTDLRNSGIGLLREFANDNEIQHVQITSTNIGFVRAYQKRFKQQARTADEEVFDGTL